MNKNPLGNRVKTPEEHAKYLLEKQRMFGNPFPLQKKKTRRSIPRCPRTMTGNHVWANVKYLEGDGFFGEGFYQTEYPFCEACGMIDDRPIKKGKQ